MRKSNPCSLVNFCTIFSKLSFSRNSSFGNKIELIPYFIILLGVVVFKVIIFVAFASVTEEEREEVGTEEKLL